MVKVWHLIRRVPYYKILCQLTDLSALLLLCGMAITIPLYYDYSVNNIYVLPKLILMRKLSIILLGLFCFRILILYERFYKTKAFLPILLFLTASLLATACSLNPYVAFFGCYSRYEGLSSLINYILLFLIASHFIKRRWQAQLFLGSAVISGILSGLYGVLQHFELDPDWLVEMEESSTFGNKNFLSAYLVICSPLALSLYSEAVDSVISKRKNPLIRVSHRLFKMVKIAFFLLAFLFFIFAIVIIRTRGAWLGLFTEGILFLILLRRDLLKKRFLSLFALLILCTVPLFFTKSTSPIERIKQTFKREEKIELAGSALVRIYIWQATLNLIVHHPLGVGPDSLKFAIPWYINPDYYTIEGGVLDKAHNIVLEIAATTGWLGILSYIWLWVIFVKFGMNVVLHKKEKRMLTIGLLSASCGYLVQNLFNFDLLTYTFLFWTGMGAMFGINQYRKEVSPNPSIVGLSLRTAIFSLILLVLFALSKVVSTPIHQDRIFAKARNYESAGLIEEAVSLYEEALSAVPWEETYYRFLVPAYKKMIARTEDREFIREIIEKIERAIRFDPNNTSYYETIATAYKRLHRLGEKDALRKVEEVLLRCIKQNPNSPETRTNLGVFYGEQGKWKKAIEVYEEALCFQKGAVRGRITTLNNLGEAYFKNGQSEKALWAFSESLETEPDQPSIYHYVALIYFKKEEYGSSCYYAKRSVELSPENVSWWNDLGSAYYKAGKLSEARDAFHKALSLDPNNEYAKKVLSVIRTEALNYPRD